MKISAAELSQLLNGSVEGDATVIVSRPAKIEEGLAGDVCFLDNNKYVKYAYSTNASVLVVDESIVFEQEVKPTLIRVKDVRTSFTKILATYQEQLKQTDSNGIEKYAFVHPTAKIGERVKIAPFCYISEDAIIGDDVKLEAGCFIGKSASVGKYSELGPSVSILYDCSIGENCVIGPGTIIGSEGFGFAPQEDGSFIKVPQTGNVVIENEVELGANNTIDRATMGSTIIRKGAKLDNLIQIAHNVEIGENTVIAAQTGISGSTKIGKNCMIGGQVGIVGHITIADGTRINAQSGVAKKITKSGTAITGSPAFDYSEAMRAQVVFKQLPQLASRLRELEEKIKDIESKK